MKLSELKPSKGARKSRKRVGCGTGSGHGGTSCRGHNGQNSRSGAGSRAWFEGGQMPLQRRLPKRGFNNPLKPAWQVVNVGDLETKELPEKITLSVLKEAGLIKKIKDPVKILGDGELTKVFEIEAHAFSKSAMEKIVNAGGKVGRI